MVLGWRRAFCTSVSEEQDRDSPIVREKSESCIRFGGFFSNPSSPRHERNSPSPPQESECRTTQFFNRSAPSSPRSPSTFSVLKSSLRLSKSNCGICLRSVKAGQGTAIFTAECGHSFHFPCISARLKDDADDDQACHLCSTFDWKEELHIIDDDGVETKKKKKKCVLKVYDDDEPLCSPATAAATRFNPILESEEEIEGCLNNVIEFGLLSEAAVVSVGKTSEIHAIVLKLKAPAAAPRRIPVDLVAVINVSGETISPRNIQFVKKVMRTVISSLSAADRLSIVAFSTASKRLLPLRRMTTAGKRSARRILDAVVSLNGTSIGATDSLKKAAKVFEDRREKNPATSILLFSDGHRSGPRVSSTRYTHMEIPVHCVNLRAWCSDSPPSDDHLFAAERISGVLGQSVQDLRLQLSLTAGSAPADISAVYSYTGKPALLGSGSSCLRVGSLQSEEERELLIEMKVPPSLGSSKPRRRLLAVRCFYTDPSTQQRVYDKESYLPIPRPRAVGSSTSDIQRLRCLFVTTRAVAESRRLVERNDVAGAHHMLSSARAVVMQSMSGSGEEFLRGLEAELAELNSRRRRRRSGGAGADEKAESLTPTSAWRAAERLAKVAIMRKSLNNRVSDLHGFEDARF